MVGARELSYYVYGAWRLVKRDTGGLQHFENTPEAFWRSFQAAIYVAPIAFIITATRLADVTTKSGPTHVFIIESLTYVIGWFLFPFIMLYLSEALSRRDRLFRYIAAYNWASILRAALLFIIFLIDQTGLFPPGLVVFLRTAAIIAVLVYVGYIARVSLEISVPAAVGVVAVDFFSSLMLEMTTVSMIGITQTSSG